MPLKLLGKKSWNVYNAANIERVRRDEADARVREAEEDRRRKEAESVRRMAELRGEEVKGTEEEKCEGGVAAEAEAAPSGTRLREASDGHSSFSRKRKRHGEDDTDFEMRVARDALGESPTGEGRTDIKRTRAEAGAAARPIVDRDGHIDLFGKVPEDMARSTRQTAPVSHPTEQPLLNLRFADAAGRGRSFGTWYAGDGDQGDDRGRAKKPSRYPPLPSTAMADPLAAMRQGAAAVRTLTQERRREASERAAEMAALMEEERRRQRRREKEGRDYHERHEWRRHREKDDKDDKDEDDKDSLEDFSLDDDKKSEKRRHRTPETRGREDQTRHEKHERHGRHHDRHRSRHHGQKRKRDTDNRREREHRS